MEEFVLLPPGYSEDRPWGRFIVLEDTETHKVKRLIVHPGKRISYQRHQKRTEHWVIIMGQAHITLDDVVTIHEPGDTILIAQGTKHRLSNEGAEPLVLVEVQRGTYFGEDDIERFDDDFGRK
jgi:mannose-6-phosphate isomerase